MSDIRDNYDQDTFEGFWQQKANETTATLQRLIDNDAATFLNLALKEIETQLLSGAEVINNPLKVGILSQLGFDISSGKIPAFFTEIFGDNDTLSSLDVATSFGFTEDQFNSIPAQAERLEASEGPSQREITGRAGRKIYDKDNNLVGIVYDGVTYRQDDSGKWVSPDAVETDADTTVLPAETGVTTQDTYLTKDYVKEIFEDRRYSDATDEEILGILAGVVEEWGDDWSKLDERSRQFEISGAVADYVKDNTINIKDLNRIFQAELGRNPTTEEVNDILGGTKGSIKGTDEDIIGRISTPEVERPEGTVNLEDLTEEQIETFWPEIKEALGELSDTVKDVVFGTSGPPTSVGDLLEDISEGIMESLKGPIAVTFDPWEGITLDLKIPVGFEISGTSIQIPIFDADGNLVPVDEIKQVFIDAKDRIWAATGGVLQQVGSIFTDGKGNIVLDVIDAGQAILEGVGLGEDGALVGTLVGAAIGELQYDPGTGEILEEGSIEDIGLDAGEEDGLADTVDDRGDDVVDRDDPDVVPLTPETGPEEKTPKPLTPPKGSQYIDDKAGNIVRAIGPDGTVYNVDENNEWSVSTSDVVTEGGTTVLPGETTIGDGTTGDEQVGGGSPYQDGSAADDFYGSFPEDTDDGTDDMPVSGRGDDVVDRDDPEVTPLTEPDDPIELQLTEDTDDDGGGGGGDDNGGGGQPPLDGGDDDGGDNGQPPLDGGGGGGGGGDDDGGDNGQPPLTNGGGGGDDGQTPEEPPLSGPPGKDGVDGVDGAAGAAGAPGSRGGYMGGLSYELPQFVGVQYQPKDYTVELDRIINESLFKGMI